MEIHTSRKGNPRVTRMNRIPNEEIRRRMKVEKNILDYIGTDPNRWISEITESSTIGKQKTGRPRRSVRREKDWKIENGRTKVNAGNG